MFCKMYKGTLKGLFEKCMAKIKTMCAADPEMATKMGMDTMDEEKGCPEKMFCLILTCLHCKMCCYEKCHKYSC